MQYLYLIKCQQFYKIGVANDVESRLAQLSTGNPFPLEVEIVYAFENADPVERVIHQKFNNKRARGEWFELSYDDKADIHKICLLLGASASEYVGDIPDQEAIEEAEDVQKAILDDGQHWYFNCDPDGNHYVYGLNEYHREPSGRKKRVYKWVLDDPRTQEFCPDEAARWLKSHKCNKVSEKS